MKRVHGKADHELEVYISVDVESAGPIPGEYSMLAIGACVVGSPDTSFYRELRPINNHFVPEAIQVSNLSLDQLNVTGEEPAAAMNAFHDWIEQVSDAGIPVFVGFNASFDWSFVNWYFHMYVGDNPFGFGALDMKAYYMGLSGCRWGESTSSQLPAPFNPGQSLTHNALDDARVQAEIFEKLLKAARVETSNEKVYE